MNTIGWIMLAVFAAIVVKIMAAFIGAKRRWRPPLPIAPAPTPSEKEQEHGHDKTVPTDRG